MNEPKSFQKASINWLPCIYTVNQQNLYKMGFFIK